MLGCRKEYHLPSAAPPQNTPSALMPLNIGNSWVYRNTETDEMDSVFADYATSIDIKYDTLIKGEKWYDIEGQVWFSNRSDGLWQRTGNSEVLAYKYPAKKGDTFSVKFSASVPLEKATVMNVDTVITTKAGSFHSLCYKYEEPGQAVYFWIAPKAGLVLEESYVSKSSGTGMYLSVKQELVSYVLK